MILTRSPRSCSSVHPPANAGLLRPGYPVRFVTFVVALAITSGQADRGEHDISASSEKQSPHMHRHASASAKKSTLEPRRNHGAGGAGGVEDAGATAKHTSKKASDVKEVLSHAVVSSRGHFVRAHHLANETERGPIGSSSHGRGRVKLSPMPKLDIDMNDTELIASVDNVSTWSTKEVLMAMGGGTGATIGGTGILDLDQDLVRRMRYQDKAVMILLLVMYFVTLGFSASFAYRQALNTSPVTFYADPRYHDMMSEGHEQDVFLANFNGPPKDVHLQVTGFVPVSSGVIGSVEWQGEYYYDAFSFALDLSQWVVQEGTTDGTDSSLWADKLPLVDGIVASDIPSLDYHLNCDTNDLAVLELRKEVAWASWEELATNIKHTIRQQGFSGVISINRPDTETVSIYKNTAWANFMHSRVTKVLCALSVLGWFIYLPYMWLRCSSTSIRSRYSIDIPITEYWPLIVDKLTADGFVGESAVANEPAVGGPTTLPGTGQLIFYERGPRPLAGQQGRDGWDSDSGGHSNSGMTTGSDSH